MFTLEGREMVDDDDDDDHHHHHHHHQPYAALFFFFSFIDKHATSTSTLHTNP
jgi:hypothetical protein